MLTPISGMLVTNPAVSRSKGVLAKRSCTPVQSGKKPAGRLDGGLAEIKAGAKDDPESLKQVAEQFEALLMAQLLKSMRETSSGGWLGTGDDKAGGTMVELAEQQFAQLLASQGGLGLADLIVQGLSKKP